MGLCRRNTGWKGIFTIKGETGRGRCKKKGAVPQLTPPPLSVCCLLSFPPGCEGNVLMSGLAQQTQQMSQSTEGLGVELQSQPGSAWGGPAGLGRPGWSGAVTLYSSSNMILSYVHRPCPILSMSIFVLKQSQQCFRVLRRG